MKKTFNLYKILWIFAAALLSCFFFFEKTVVTVSADDSTTETTYSDVLEDLEKDESFDVEKYPTSKTDYTLRIIQIAESAARELYVYVYRPCEDTKDLLATTINLSIPKINETEQKWYSYKLTLVSKNGVFEKYKVNNVTVSSESVRYYDIAAIHRPYKADFDKKPTSDDSPPVVSQTTNEIGFEVAQLWTVTTTKNGVEYNVQITDVVKIPISVVGFMRYDDGYFNSSYHWSSTDSHFIAFNTDVIIDDLYEATVEYEAVNIKLDIKIKLGKTEINEVSRSTTNEKVDLSYTEVSGNLGDGWFSKKYIWNQIESTSSFIKKNREDLNLTDGNISELEKTAWILRFTETDYACKVTGAFSGDGYLTEISNVSVLRLKYKTDGVTYNLGVVSDKVTGDRNPFAEADNALDDFIESLSDMMADFGIMFLVLIIVFAVGVGIYFLVMYCPFIFKGMWTVIKFPFDLIGKFFKWLGKLFKKKK